MTQILLYRSENGIAIATDSRGVAFEAKSPDEARHLQVQKLFALGPEVIAVAGGAGFGIRLCEKFQRYVGQAGLSDFHDIAESALGFFRTETDAFRRGHLSAGVRSELNRFYVILAGFAPEGDEQSFPLLFMGSEQADDPVHVLETSNILTIPRQVTLEYRLAHLQPSDDRLQRVEALFEKFLVTLAESDDDIGPPYHFIRITADGIQVRTV